VSRREERAGRSAPAAAVAAALIALGTLARVRAANAPFRAPDEALHLQMAGAPSLSEVYRVSLGNAHPPLFVLLLHGWMKIARADWTLRLLPVFLGALALVAAWWWTRRLVGENAGLLALALLSLLPSVVLVSSELRGYALLLCTGAAALAALERGLDEASPAALAAFGVFGVLALLSHYAAFRLAAAAVVYSAARVLAGPRSRRVVAAWGLSCAALAGVALLLLRTHVAHLRGGPLEAEVRSTWLSESYFGGGGARAAIAFLLRQTLSLCHYLFSATAPGVVALALYGAGLVLLARERRAAALLLALPPALAALGGILGLYPYGGTRHDVDLVLFLSAGAALGFSRATGERRWVAVATAAALAPAAFLAAG
jgi:hypothetical protein